MDMSIKNILAILAICLLILLVYKMTRINSEEFITKLMRENTSLKILYKDDATSNMEGVIVVNDKAMFDKIATKGELGLGESYMDGDWDTPDLEYIMLELLSKEEQLVKQIKNQGFNFLLMECNARIKSMLPNNTIESSKENIASHYNIGNDLFEKMLGKHMQYTCAYFYKPNMTLDEAQYAKMELIAKKLDLKPGMKVLDIGCGYGSMANHLATKYGVNVTGVTLSEEQKRYADEKFSHPNVTILLKDYRHVNDKFDRVYSVGMFEHVGRKNYHEYYDKCYELLKDDGIMLIHTIGCSYPKWDAGNCFLMTYIFPEAELPHFSNLTGEFADKWHMEDMQNFGLSYAKTLREWRKNIGNWENLDSYPIRFKRMWHFYLSEAAATFQHRKNSLWQIVYTKRNSGRADDCHHIR